MNRVRRFLGLAIIVTLFFVFVPISSYTWAECTQTDLRGTWQVYEMGANESGSWWCRMVIKVRSSGAVRSGTYVICDGGEKEMISGGELSVTSGCIVRGVIYPEIGGFWRIKHGALDREKTHIDGVWVDDDGDVGIFSAVKK